jgi:putative AlgH/UPF0301 family transcriptional regulator
MWFLPTACSSSTTTFRLFAILSIIIWWTILIDTTKIRITSKRSNKITTNNDNIITSTTDQPIPIENNNKLPNNLYDLYNDDDDDHDDDDNPLFLRIENAILAPSHLIGSIDWLHVGITLKARKDKTLRHHPNLFDESVILITKLDTSSVYQGLVLNKPLPSTELNNLKLRINHEKNWLNSKLIKTENIHYRVGGPVGNQQEAWFILHSCTSKDDANGFVANHIITGQIWMDGENLKDMLELCSTPKILFYKCCQWLPGQLEKEIESGLWIQAEKQVETIEDIINIQ